MNWPGDFRSNHILAALDESERNAALEHAAPVIFPIGHTIQYPGQPYQTVFFPTFGIVSAVGTLTGGHNVEIATVGVEGVVGVGPVLGLRQVRLWFVAQIGATGYGVPVETFRRIFRGSEALRELTLTHIGRLLGDIALSASCNRFHTHRERLARWLVVTVQKTGALSLPLTHDFIAQMVGGPRHAVTAALADLRARGAINYQRGLIVVVDEQKLLDAACECVGSAHAPA